MNIAILINSLVVGGAERFAQRIGDYYAERGENVFYFLGNYGLKQDYAVKGEIINTGITQLRSMNDSKLFTAVEFVMAVCKMKSLKMKYKIDVSISVMEDFNYINIFSRCSDKVIVRVATILSAREELNELYYRKSYLSFVYNHADFVVVMSTDGFNEMTGFYGIDRNKVRIIPNVAPKMPFVDSNVDHQKNKTIIHVARFDPIKQQDKLIRAFKYVTERDGDARLLFVGNGILEDYLRSLCAMYDLSKKITFFGYSNDPSKLLRSAAAFVMTSKVEGFPNAMVEAMSHGLPIIATDAPGGIRDILGRCEADKGTFAIHQYGIMSPPMPKKKVCPTLPLTHEEEELGIALLEILNNDTLRRCLHKKSLERADCYCSEKIMPMWDNIVYK